MIQVTDLAKRYDKQFVVEDITLSIKQGEIVGLLGPNGAGKTTTLRMMAGVLPPTKGSVEIDGKNLKTNYNAAKATIGFLPENNPLYDEMTVAEYLQFWATVKGVTKEQKKEATAFVVENCGIAGVYYRPIGELSKGYRQRVGLSQALLTKPPILLLDEPTEGLDPNERQNIASLIKSLGKERTIIISSHVLPEIAKLCSRLIILSKGEVVADNTPERLRQSSGGGQLIELEVKGPNIVPTLTALEGVKRVKQSRKDYYLIESAGKTDLRERLFETAVENRWTVLTLLKKEQALEDVFSKLTQD